MNKIYIFLAPGFEDIEMLGAVDVLRRAALPVQPKVTVAPSATSSKTTAYSVDMRVNGMLSCVFPQDTRATLLSLP